MEATWYDVIENPLTPKIIDCWDVHSFVSYGNDFEMKIRQHVHGRNMDDALNARIHFIANEDGTYSPNQTQKVDFTTTSKKAISHRFDKKVSEVDALADFIFAGKFFFITDYKNYFIVASCDAERGLSVFVKNRTLRPDGQDMLNLWNMFIKYRELPQQKVVLSEACINRKSGSRAWSLHQCSIFSHPSIILLLYVGHCVISHILFW
nr:uncharacterized protein LOC120346283 isoform X2 [Styela clava]